MAKMMMQLPGVRLYDMVCGTENKQHIQCLQIPNIKISIIIKYGHHWCVGLLLLKMLFFSYSVHFITILAILDLTEKIQCIYFITIFIILDMNMNIQSHSQFNYLSENMYHPLHQCNGTIC